ncbi:MAG: AMP-binding protein [Opitutaceae bacterium]|jgi:acyl-CoA synthetase (AMP-forming)/AMP-acid ligase II|nr:AMP-binding protein [Opitutaceae bacterium]
MNIARHLPLMAARQPRRDAVKVPRGRTRSGGIDYLTLTFAELDAEVRAWSAHLRARGVRPGDRALVMVRQGLPLIASVFALFNAGAVPVIIDPGMGLRGFLRCVAHSRPRILLGIPLARLLSRVMRRPFRTVETRIPVSGSPLARMRRPAAPKTETALNNDGLAAILFTSGSTGAPKGVCYEHAMFEAQVRSIRAAYAIEPGETDLSMLPVFALFAPALGMTTIVPELDPRRPSALDPVKIIQAIRQENVTNSFGSPTLWNKLAGHCIQKKITLPSLRRVLCAGAPVPAALWEKARKILPSGNLHSPYGATECLPVSTINSDEIASLHTPPLPPLPPPQPAVLPAPPASLRTPDAPPAGLRGTDVPPVSDCVARATRPCPGACVGRATPEIQIKIIAITDAPIATLADARELPPGEIGEIIVTGPAVTREYDHLPAATAAAKIRDDATATAATATAAAPLPATGHKPLPTSPGTGVWHRMGDTGCLDADGRLWFCGRKAERVETAAGTLFTEPCEHVFRAHPSVTRAALIGLGPPGSQTPAIVVQPVDKKLARPSPSRSAFAAELRALAAAHPRTAGITRFYFHPDFPVDVRHNAKIHRLALAKWAAKQKNSA